MKKSRSNILSSFYNTPLAILPEKAEEIDKFISRWSGDLSVTMEDLRNNAMQSRENGSAGGEGQTIEPDVPTIGFMQVTGTLMNRFSFMDAISGATFYEDIVSQCDYFGANDEIDHVVMEFDTPGGEVNGIDGAGDAISRLAAIKPVYALVNDMAASAGYWLASKCTKIFVSQSSLVGSIGVLAVHTDYSEAEEKAGRKHTIMRAGANKAVGHPYSSLEEGDKKIIQSRLDNAHSIFISSVAAGRGIDEADVKPLADGSVFSGAEAIENGLADDFAHLSTLISDIQQGKLDMLKGNASNTKETAQANTNAGGETVDLVGLQGTVNNLTSLVEQLTGSVQQMAQVQQASMEEQKAERAKALLDPLVAAGSITPAKAYGEDGKSGLFAQAIANYDLVETVVSAISPNTAVHLSGGSAIPPANPTGNGSMDAATKEVFSQLGLLSIDGKIDPLKNTLMLDENGRAAHYADDAISGLKVRGETVQILGNMRSLLVQA